MYLFVARYSAKWCYEDNKTISFPEKGLHLCGLHTYNVNHHLARGCTVYIVNIIMSATGNPLHTLSWYMHACTHARMHARMHASTHTHKVTFQHMHDAIYCDNSILQHHRVPILPA